jgi:dipeptidyl aminopeptidase/acylaminoacyl peptidase
MRPRDLAGVVVVEELDVTADRASAVVARRTVRRGRYETHLWAVDLARRARPRRLTSGAVRDSTPRFSPDGRSVAFVRGDAADDAAPNRLCVLNIRTGGLRTLAGARPGIGPIGEVAWSPDGSRLALTAEVDPLRFVVGDRPAVGSKAERAPKLPAPTARRVDRADWRWDGTGHRDRWQHVFVLAPGGAPRQITRGDWGASGITWHPDGRTVAFVANLQADADLDPFTSIWAVDVDTGPRSKRSQPKCVLDAPGGASRPAYSPDGRWLAAVGVLDEWPLDDVSPGLLLGPADGSRPAWALGAELDRPFGNWADTDLNGWMVGGRPGPAWIDATTIAGVVTDRGRSLPERWVVDGRSGELVEGPAAAPWADVTTHAIAVAPASADPSRIVALGTVGGRAMEVLTVDLSVRPSHRVSRTCSTFGSSWQRRLVQPEMLRLDVPGPGGTIETWVASPPDVGDATLPTIVDVHGGPLGCWAPAPHNEVTMLVGAGYRVVLPNIRGSAGYGRDWIRPQLGDWGGVDADDVHAALDHVIALGWADPKRLGALGLSYGGFMVNWLVGTSDRFRAAVSENGVTNQVASWANSDGGPEFCRAALLGDPFTSEGVERLWRQSPLRHVSEVRTPLLMLQAEADLRCPPQDSEQFFVALRHLRREVEYVLYPDESHVYASAGRLDRRIDRMERVLAWFATHLV